MSKNDRYVLGIDLGTSGPKVGLLRTDGTLIDHEFEPVELLLRPGGGAEQDPAAWWTAVVRATRRLQTRRLVGVHQIVAIGATAQWSGTVAVDPDGEPLTNAILWMDSRGARYIDEVTGGRLRIQGYGAEKLVRWLRLTGGFPSRSGKGPIGHILYLRHEQPEVYAAARWFLEPKDWLNLKLTGRCAASYDSIALHWVTDNRNLDRVAYDPGLLALAGLERERLPELLRSVDVLGPLRPEAAAELGLGRQVQVVAGAPDVTSAAVGSGAVRDFEGHLYLGTSSWLTCHVPEKKTDVRRNMAALPSAIPDRYFVANGQESAGACLGFLRDCVLLGKDELSPEKPPENFYRAFETMADRAPAGSGGLIFLPWLYGERTPVEDHTVRGGFVNLSLDADRPRLTRAVFEGVAYNTRWLLGAVESFIRRPFPALNAIGGGARSDLWCQIHADVLDREIRQVADPRLANLRGAALIAAVGLGLQSFEGFAGEVEIRRTFRPDPAHRETYDRLFREFVGFYRRNRRAFARLNG